MFQILERPSIGKILDILVYCPKMCSLRSLDSAYIVLPYQATAEGSNDRLRVFEVWHKKFCLICAIFNKMF